MSSSRTKVTGLAFLFCGIALYGSWILWVVTRAERPVHMPILMTVGHVRTREFKVNLSEPYRIEIEVAKSIPFDTLNCLLGMSMGRTSTNIQDCPDRPSVVKASWVLTSEGQIVASGSSDDYRSGIWANDTISRELGHFQSQRGRSYVLDVNVLSDGTSLSTGKPQLEVEVDPEFNEGIMVWSAMLMLGTAVLVLIGGIILTVSFIRNRRAKVATLSAS